MPSSISSSEPIATRVRLDRFTIALLSTAVALLLITEAVSILGFDRISKVQRRELAERRALLAVRDSGASEDPHVAILGNSLMHDGVDLPLLKAQMDPRYVPISYSVFATNYYDWYFGLRRLFAEGMRPRYIVLGLSPNQLADSSIRGDYSARYLFRQLDLWSVIRLTHMNPTAASGFLLSHYSEFYSTRETIRGFIMSRVLPNVGELLHSRLAVYRDPEIPASVLKPLASERLEGLDELCRANGAHFVLVVPPSYQKGGQTIAQAGREKGITVLLPVGESELDSSYYQSDGFHLNDEGSRVFTTRLAESLRENLPK